jgi:hypothetical protein
VIASTTPATRPVPDLMPMAASSQSSTFAHDLRANVPPLMR